MPGLRDWTRFLHGLIVGLIACLSWPIACAADPESASDSQGVEFWLTFPGNVRYIPPELLDLSLFITGDLDTSGTVSIPGLAFSLPFTVTAGAVTQVPLPPTAATGRYDLVEIIENNGIHLTALNPVSVFGQSRLSTSTDAYLALPTESLGTEYIVLAYHNFSILTGSQFSVVATADGTSVTITPSITTGARPGGVPYQIILQRGETYQLRNSGPTPSDLSGTSLTADKPIAVFAGHECARVPSALLLCDYLVEQLPPISSWGKNFATMPLAARSNGDTFRFLASADDTHVHINDQLLATLTRGQFFEHIISTPAHITADRPILVAQYAHGIQFDKTTGDPFMMLIPPIEGFGGHYTIATPSSYFESHFVNVVAPNAAVGMTGVDGVTIEAEHFVAIGESGFSGAQVPITPGAHQLTSSLPFGVVVYGFRVAESYGYPGGMARPSRAKVARFELIPETATSPIGTSHCVTAIANGRDGSPVAGVQIAFVISGANPTGGYAATAENGQAELCYQGVNPGTDTIVATSGTMTDTATKVWLARLLLYSDGSNMLTVDSLNGTFTLSYLVDVVPQGCSGNGAGLEADLLTITSLCQEDPRDVLRAVGPVDASVTVQLIDHGATTGGRPDIRRFILMRQ